MNTYQAMDLAYADMALQEEIYKPTSFWNDASQLIIKELNHYGVENFRSIPSILDYFAPTYGVPGNSFSKEMVDGIVSGLKNKFPTEEKARVSLENFLNGNMSALSDYRVLMASDNPRILPYLHTFSESNYGNPVEQFDFDGRMYSRSSLNYLLGLSMLKKHLSGYVPKIVVEIGGGFGTLGEILLNSGIEGLKYIDIDIPPTSFVAQTYLSHVFGEQQVATYEKTCQMKAIAIESLPKASVLSSWQIEKLQGKADLFVNFISFQEMEPPIVKNYLEHVSRLNTEWILLRNMREGKQIKTIDTVGVEVPIKGDDYHKMLPDYELIERNVIPFGYRTTDNYHSELHLLRRKK